MAPQPISLDPPAPGERPSGLVGKIKEYIFTDVPTLIWAPQARQLCTEDVSTLEAEFPLPTWTFACRQPDGSTMPQVLAHRGNKHDEPENSMRAFRSAVAAGAHGLETDTHVTKDGVVVLTHDGNLKRCFGRNANVIDLDWDEVKQLRSTRAPHEPLPSLTELLAYLAEPGMEHVWLLLDIKIDVDPTIIMSLLASTIAAAPASPNKPWNSRIILGVWGTKYLPLAKRHLPAYAVMNIGFSTLYARRFLRHAYVGFNLLATVMTLWPIGPRFIRAAHARHRPVVLWTVNDARVMRWAMAHGVDGIITDHPARLVQVMDEWTAGARDVALSWRQQGKALWFNCMAFFFYFLIIQWGFVDRFDGGRSKKRSWQYKQISGPSDAQAPKLT